VIGSALLTGLILGAILISLVWIFAIALCMAAAERDTFDEMNRPPEIPPWVHGDDDEAA
jgi:hypothetical protein